MRLSDTENTIIDAMARAFYVNAYASQQEERAENGKKANCAGSGQDWMDVAPKTPKYAREFALMFAGQLPHLAVALNDAAWADYLDSHNITTKRFDLSLEQREEWQEQVDALKTDEYARLFGHYLAMQGMGTGVSWFDDHAKFDIKVPHVEAYL